MISGGNNEIKPIRRRQKKKKNIVVLFISESCRGVKEATERRTKADVIRKRAFARRDGELIKVEAFFNMCVCGFEY